MGWRGGLHRAGECTPPRPEAKQNTPAVISALRRTGAGGSSLSSAHSENLVVTRCIASGRFRFGVPRSQNRFRSDCKAEKVADLPAVPGGKVSFLNHSRPSMGAVKSWRWIYCLTVLSILFQADRIWMRFEIGTSAEITPPLLTTFYPCPPKWNTCCCLRMFMLRLKSISRRTHLQNGRHMRDPGLCRFLEHPKLLRCVSLFLASFRRL